MALPAVSIPSFPLPFTVPTEVHPCIVHLAVALPLVILLLELVNLFAKKRALGVFSFFLMLLLAVVLFGAYLTGTADAKEAGDLLKTGALHQLFEAHKIQGIYLVYSALVLVVIKLLSVLIRKTPMRILFLIALIAFVAFTLNTAKKGKELVFDYGVNVKALSVGKTVPKTVKSPSVLSHTAVEKSEPEPESRADGGMKKPESPAAQKESVSSTESSAAEAPAAETRKTSPEAAPEKETAAPAVAEENTTEKAAEENQKNAD